MEAIQIMSLFVRSIFAISFKFALCFLLTLPAYGGENDELIVKSSPAEHRVFQLEAGDAVVDTDALPKGAIMAVLVRNGESQTLRFWDFLGNRIVENVPIPSSEKIAAIAMHPRGESLYAIVHKGNKWQIIRHPIDAKEWKPAVLYHDTVPLRRPVFSTQRFAASYLSKTPKSVEYRLYFAAQTSSGKF